MKIQAISVFPELFDSLHAFPLVKRAEERGLLEFTAVDLKKFADGSFRHIDDAPFGGGAGMVLRYPVLHKAIEACRSEKSHVILLSPAGKTYHQKRVRELAQMEDLILVCGHYEGIDARILEEIDEEISLGDYVLSGGEPGAIVIVDSLVRLLGTIRKNSTEDESFENGLLEYPQYTKPQEYSGKKVPEVLLSGNHEKIRQWRLEQSLKTTLERRPDLLENRELSKEEAQILEKLKEEI